MRPSWLIFSGLWLTCFSRTLSQLVDWEMQSSEYVNDTWFKIKAPATIMAGLVQNGIYTDALYGVNLQSIDPAPFSVPWHFRINVDISDPSLPALLIFKGLNYRATLSINGQVFGTELVGAFRYFQLDISGLLRQGSNTFELVMSPQNNTWRTSDTVDLGISFIDWAPFPPDNSTGLWRETELVFLENAVSVSNPLVTCEVSESAAILTVMAELYNTANTASQAVLAFQVFDSTGQLVASGQSLVTLNPKQVLQVAFSPTEFSQLKLVNPQLWWPWQMGESPLYTLNLNVSVQGEPSDSLSTHFGVRQITDFINQQNYRVYRINGKPLLIRGAGYAPTLFLESETDPLWQSRLLAQTRAANLNAIRFEGKFPNGNIFELADQMGMLMIPGFACCDSWQHWNHWGPEQMEVARESLRSQVKRLRIHASILSFWYSSDELPPPAIEQLYLDVFLEEAWPNPTLASASKLTSSITGPTGVKMSGPYSWVPPNYWLNDSKAAADYGGAFGFLTEGGPGEAPLTLEALSATISAKDLWPMDAAWDYHCGNPQGVFHDLRFFTPPLYARYGPATSAADYLKKSQAAAYEGHRAMFEAYSRNKYVNSTGLIQWMLNSAWPSNVWHLVDAFWTNGGSYFGTKKACESLHAQYSYTDRSIWLVNSRSKEFDNITVGINVFSIYGKLLFSNVQRVGVVAADSSSLLATLPIDLPGITDTYFLRLSAVDQEEERINDYWLSTTEDVLNYSASTFYRTPCVAYADFTLLQTLPPVRLSSSAVFQVHGDELLGNVTIWNTEPSIAFMVHARLLRSDATPSPLHPPDVAPIFWSDNFLTLMPNEARTIYARMATADVGLFEPSLVLETYTD